jgi:2-phospho-L-lactate guanylyltransferase
MSQVVIAARGGAEAKSRLAGVMSPAERSALTEHMLADMLVAVAQTPGVSAVWVVTPTDAIAAMAVAYGARVIRQTEPSGLNAAFDLAHRTIAERAPYAAIGMLVGDLPLLAASDLEAALSLARTHAVVLAPALADGGTGAIVLRAGARIGFAFGADSFNRHAAAARQAGHTLAIVEAMSLGLDVDRPDDLAAVIARGPGTRTAAFLSDRQRAASRR